MNQPRSCEPYPFPTERLASNQLLVGIWGKNQTTITIALRINAELLRIAPRKRSTEEDLSFGVIDLRPISINH
jgi:hypothetical protein